MFSKLSLSLLTALAFVTLTARSTLAAGPETDFATVEAGIPDSIDYAHRMPARSFPSNEEIESLESGNPDSVRYGDRVLPASEGASRAESMTFDHPRFEGF